MRAFIEGYDDNLVRLHPWTESNHRSPGMYYDFRKNPELIRTSLEEFVPYSRYAAVEAFYELLEWLNGEDSPFETNDCRLEEQYINRQRDLANKDLGRSSSFMIFFRGLSLNLSNAGFLWQLDNDPNTEIPEYIANRNIQWLAESIIGKLQSVYDTPQVDTIVGLRYFHAQFSEAPVSPEFQFGHELAIRVWGWGDSEEEIMANLELAYRALLDCFKAIATELPTMLQSAREPSGSANIE